MAVMRNKWEIDLYSLEILGHNEINKYQLLLFFLKIIFNSFTHTVGEYIFPSQTQQHSMSSILKNVASSDHDEIACIRQTILPWTIIKTLQNI